MKSCLGLIVGIIAAMSLQGCVVALLPVAVAAGALGKTQVDAVQRARKAEAGMEALPADQRDPIVTVGPPETAEPEDVAKIFPPATGQLQPDSAHPYYRFANYALEQAAASKAGNSVRSAVLIENISLADPRTMPCEAKPMAVVIDVDIVANPDDALPLPGLAELLQPLRAADIRVAWISDMSAADLADALVAPEDEAPVLYQSDILSSGVDGGLRKQERRWELAKDFCVVAIAGDKKSDFDELYDYLKIPEYAIRLDAFWNRGWFNVPPPLANTENAQ